jgi:phosphopantetheine--protein transferase-like protein
MIGIDVVSFPEFQRQMELGGARFLSRAFGESGAQNKDVEHLAGLWAAKEAVYKAAGIPTLQIADVVITHDASGRSRATAKGQRFDISLSRTAQYVVATAMRIAP